MVWIVACALVALAIVVALLVVQFRAKDEDAKERNPKLEGAASSMVPVGGALQFVAASAANDVVERASGAWPAAPTAVLLTTETQREELAAEYVGTGRYAPTVDTLAAILSLVPTPDPDRNPRIPAAIRGGSVLAFLPGPAAEWQMTVVMAGEILQRHGIPFTPEDARLLAAKLARGATHRGVATK